MERRVFFVLMLILASGFVFAAEDGWGDISSGNETIEEISEEVDITPVLYEDTEDVSQSSGDGTYFTKDFYIALGLIALALIIVGFFAWLWIRGAKDQWAK